MASDVNLDVDSFLQVIPVKIHEKVEKQKNNTSYDHQQRLPRFSQVLQEYPGDSKKREFETRHCNNKDYKCRKYDNNAYKADENDREDFHFMDCCIMLNSQQNAPSNSQEQRNNFGPDEQVYYRPAFENVVLPRNPLHENSEHKVKQEPQADWEEIGNNTRNSQVFKVNSENSHGIDQCFSKSLSPGLEANLIRTNLYKEVNENASNSFMLKLPNTQSNQTTENQNFSNSLKHSGDSYSSKHTTVTSMSDNAESDQLEMVIDNTNEKLIQKYFPLTLGLAVVNLKEMESGRDILEKKFGKTEEKDEFREFLESIVAAPPKQELTIYGTKIEKDKITPLHQLDYLFDPQFQVPKFEPSAVVASPYIHEIANLRVQKLQIEEDRIMERRRRQELNKIYGPTPGWYSFKDRRFTQELPKNNHLIRRRKNWQDMYEHFEALENGCEEYRLKYFKDVSIAQNSFMGQVALSSVL